MKVTGAETKVQKPKTKKGKRALQQREPKLVEDSKRALILFGGKTSQITKDVLSDLHKLKSAGDSVKYTRKNDDVRPFEAGGDTNLEHFSQKTDSSLFALGNHSKKRPHNIVLGRFFDHRLHDVLELGVERFRGIKEFAKAATAVQIGNKPCFVFVGDGFDSNSELKMAKSLLLDFFRGRQIDAINLKGLDHVMFVAATGNRLLLRQYAIAFKKSGAQVPRTELAEIGPRIDFSIRRSRAAPDEIQTQSMKQPKLDKKKEKNVSFDSLEGKVGRVYMPKQDLNSMALNKMKGLKRERQSAAADAAEKKAKTSNDE